ncbi:(2Fe-2S)-binding protein [Streptosporangium sp. NPDC051022]|uniref:(2Fe-2S)-binding protein n=1 Tax=Streptosporangium sp. NPDC051022 TaxID=3155752 RepID=UPI0034169BBC
MIDLRVNGTPYTVDGSPLRPLAGVLREELGLTGTKLGCEAGDCGACTVLLDGQAVASCLLPAVRAEGKTVTTVEGLGAPGHPHPLQEAFKRHAASQCGFCIPGILMAATEIVARPGPLTRADVVAGLTGNLCRCTGYAAVIDAVLDAHAQLHPAAQTQETTATPGAPDA